MEKVIKKDNQEENYLGQGKVEGGEEWGEGREVVVGKGDNDVLLTGTRAATKRARLWEPEFVLLLFSRVASPVDLQEKEGG